MKEDGQGDGVSKACPQQAAADSRGSRTLRVVQTPLLIWGGTRRGRRVN